jgi:hypothetical protein
LGDTDGGGFRLQGTTPIGGGQVAQVSLWTTGGGGSLALQTGTGSANPGFNATVGYKLSSSIPIPIPSVEDMANAYDTLIPSFGQIHFGGDVGPQTYPLPKK